MSKKLSRIIQKIISFLCLIWVKKDKLIIKSNILIKEMFENKKLKNFIISFYQEKNLLTNKKVLKN